MKKESNFFLFASLFYVFNLILLTIYFFVNGLTFEKAAIIVFLSNILILLKALFNVIIARKIES